MRRHYKAVVNREGRWWMVHIPEIDGLTQARRIGEAEQMAREYIALSTGTPIADIDVTIASVIVPNCGDVLPPAHQIEELRRAAGEAEAMAAGALRKYTEALTTAGIPVRDIAALIHVSPQRISQVAKPLANLEKIRSRQRPH
jgi:hypothetical protein